MGAVVASPSIIHQNKNQKKRNTNNINIIDRSPPRSPS